MTLRGVGVSAGVVLGSALIVHDAMEEPVACREIGPKAVKQEVARLDRAFRSAQDEIRVLRDRVGSEVGVERARIFDAQIEMLADDHLAGEAARAIEKEHVNAEWALREVRDRLLARFKELGEELFRDRMYDVKDVTKRVGRCLAGACGEGARTPAGPSGGVVLVADEITPSDAATLDTENVRALVTQAGGRTSHTAILAKSLGIPAVLGAVDATSRIRTGDLVLVDGGRGVVLVGPTPAEVASYRHGERDRLAHERALRRVKKKPAVTADGRKVFLQANIELAEEVGPSLAAGAEGIGLYRTEFLYLSQKDGHEPSEEEHFAAYKSIASRVNPYSAIIRTLDLGGEKLLRTAAAHAERDESERLKGQLASVLGLRAIRLCLARPDLFRTQLRAILRASAFGRVKIMLPFVSSVEEVRQAKVHLRECMAELRRARVRFNEGIEVGAMIEVPAAAAIADLLAREVSFFSIGTNDLIQYLLAVDRADERVAHLYEPLHPALLRTVSKVVELAHAGNVRVGMCGEMAADPLLTPLLVGFGLNELSMDPKSLHAIKFILTRLRYDECTHLALEILELESAADIRSRLTDFARARFPRWLIPE